LAVKVMLTNINNDVLSANKL